jgi:beta-lactamase regulating signal transducer with metallopeptidase domain
MTSFSNGLVAALLTYAVHSTLFLGTACVLHARWLRGSADRDLMWKLAAFGAVVTTALQVWLSLSPGMPALAMRWRVDAPVTVEASATRAEESERAMSAPKPAAQDARERSDPLPRDGEARTPSAGTGTNASVTNPARRWSWSSYVVLAWLVGATLSFTLLWRRYARAHRLLSQRRPETEPVLLDVLQQLSVSFGLPGVRLTRCDVALSPVALGLREICVPADLVVRLSPAQRRTMLAHELAHLRRRDSLWLAAFAGLEAIFFFQPLNRLARRRFQKAAERLFDQHALAQTNEPLALAQCLAEVARWLRAETATALPYPTIAESSSPLLERVQRVLTGVREPVTSSAAMRWCAAGTLVLASVLAPGFSTAVRPARVVLPAAQQTGLAAAVNQLGQGTVRFSFAARPGVCGTGEEPDGTRMFALSPDRDWWPTGKPGQLALYVWDRGKLMRNDVGVSGQWTTRCNQGPVRIDLAVRNGRVYALDLSVAEPAPRLVGPLRDLGLIPAREAVDYLGQLTREQDGEVATRILLATAMADPNVSVIQLRRLSQDERLPAATRQIALSWIATFRLSDAPTARAPDLSRASKLHLDRVADMRVPMPERLDALAAATRAGLRANTLLDVYDRVPDRAMRVELIDWLSQREDAAVRAKFQAIVRDAAVWEEQQAALRALLRSSDPAARARAAQHLNKQPNVDVVLPDLATQGSLAQRVARVQDGIVHIAYGARPDVCGSGVDDDGAGMFALLPNDRWRPASAEGMAAFYSFDRDDFSRLSLKPANDWLRNCINGPAHLLLVVRAGRVTALNLAVGTSLRGSAVTTELGQVSADEAVDYLLELAANAGQNIASNAILAAVLADGQPTLYAQLIRIAADLTRPERVRRTALHWVALDPAPETRAAIRRNAGSLPKDEAGAARNDYSEQRASIGESGARLASPDEWTLEQILGIVLDDRQPLSTRERAIAWAEQRDVSPAVLSGLYDHIETRALKLFLLKFLASCDNEPTSRKLIEIMASEPDPELRRMARASLQQHHNAVARSARE